MACFAVCFCPADMVGDKSCAYIAVTCSLFFSGSGEHRLRQHTSKNPQICIQQSSSLIKIYMYLTIVSVLL